MQKAEQFSDSEFDDASKITEPSASTDYTKRREALLFKMMSDPSHKAMLYFLEVLLNSDAPLTVSQLAAKFTSKSFSPEMREACGGGSVDALTNFLCNYPSLFAVGPSGLVSAVSIDIPGFDEMSEASAEINNNANSLQVEKCSSRSSYLNGSCADLEMQSNGLKNVRYKRMSPTNKQTKIYRPPYLRDENINKRQQESYCELCPHLAAATTTLVHCPLKELNFIHCKQQCAAILQHASYRHCCCSQFPSDQFICCQNKAPCHFRPPVSMMNFALETEAVRFFQQKLVRREERWVLIKSLAGHLSQAPSEIRAIVGPQLEFRNFLLKHPHVFEVQGDLVGLKDTFSTTCLSRHSKPFMHKLNSNSSTNLTNIGNFRVNSTHVHRPKSLMLIPQTSVSVGDTAVLECSSTRSYSNTDDFHHLSNDRQYFSHNPGSELRQAFNVNTTSSFPRSNAPEHSENISSHQLNSFPKIEAQSAEVTSSGDQTGETWLNSDEGSQSTSENLTTQMTSNEYRATMLLRKVLVKHGGAAGEIGLSYTELSHVLSNKASASVRDTIGWTQIEMEEFIMKHPMFFEVHTAIGSNRNGRPSSDDGKTLEVVDTRVSNRRVEKMINIVITGNLPHNFGSRTLTNRCGPVFHVAKLWGIIDLGQHEHVFFDKSILKYVDDLQKHFKVNEILYFNAVLAPKESRAKWRATQVWKESDKEIVDRLNSAIFGNAAGRKNSPQNDIFANLKSDNLSQADTNVISANEKRPTKNADTQFSDSENDPFDSDSITCNENTPKNFGLCHHKKHLHSSNGIAFLSDEIQDELKKLLGPETSVKSSTFMENTESPYCMSQSSGSDEDTSITGCLEDISLTFSDGQYVQSESSSKLASNRVTSSTRIKGVRRKSLAEVPGTRCSIAVQTLATGDIMATQIFHDIENS